MIKTALNAKEDVNFAAGEARTLVWRRAGLLGGLWAAAEVVLGSFLHNLKVPFAGAFLAAIGVLLLMAGFRHWRQNGLFWRSALVCAVMKSISPSAVILGPMTGIMLEGFFMEVVVRLTFGTAIGCVLAGSIAVCLTLVQRIANLLITYGLDFVELYNQLYRFALDKLRVEDANPLTLIVVLFMIHALMGAGAALLGVVGGHHAGSQRLPVPVSHTIQEAKSLPAFLRLEQGRSFSLPLLLVNLVALIAALGLLGKLSLATASVVAAAYLSLAVFRYRRALRLLMRPWLWGQLVLVVLLSGFLLGALGSERSVAAGLDAGLRMTLRALMVVVGFAVLGFELRNPVIVEWLRRRLGRQTLEAVEAGFQSLPLALEAIRKCGFSWRRPWEATALLIRQIEFWLDAEGFSRPPAVVILCGERGAGKSGSLLAAVRRLQAGGFRAGGFVAQSVWEGNQRTGYDLVSCRDETKHPLCRIDPEFGKIQQGPFFFSEAAIERGRTMLSQESNRDADLVVIDEVGHLELRGEVWARDVANWSTPPEGVVVVLVVRRKLVEAVTTRWRLEPTAVVDVSEGIEALVARLQTSLELSRNRLSIPETSEERMFA